jgi:hypothetical protein
MCLHKLLPKEQKQKILDKISREGITVYKVVRMGNLNRIYPLYRFVYDEFRPGKNEAKTHKRIAIENSPRKSKNLYKSGFHFYKTKKSAIKKQMDYSNSIIIKCIVKKSWITEIGKEHDGIVIVAKKAIFPEYKEREW